MLALGIRKDQNIILQDINTGTRISIFVKRDPSKNTGLRAIIDAPPHIKITREKIQK